MHRIYTGLWQALARITITADALAYIPLCSGRVTRGLYFTCRIAQATTTKHLSEHAPEGDIDWIMPLAAPIGVYDLFGIHHFGKQQMQLTRSAPAYLIQRFFERLRSRRSGSSKEVVETFEVSVLS